MVPASFAESNVVLNRSQDMTEEECVPLCVLATHTSGSDPLPVVISCWQLTSNELEIVAKTGMVWLIVYGVTMPPVALSGEKPFEMAEG